MVSEITERYVERAKESIDHQIYWNNMRKVKGIAINLKGYKILNWKNLAKRDGVFMMVSPSDRDPGWVLVSRDSDLIPIPPDKDQIFRHDSGFMAAYSSFTGAYLHGLLIIEEYERREDER